MRRIAPLLAALTSIAAPASAQPGNLFAAGQIDDATAVGAFAVISAEFSDLEFEGSEDAAACAASGAALAIADPTVDFGTAEYRACVTGLVGDVAFRIAGGFRFATTSVDARASVTLSTFATADCTGAATGSLFAGYAWSDVTSWQTVTATGAPAPAGTQSAWLRILVTQSTGSDPAVEVFFDDVQLTLAGWISGEGFESGDTCRWHETVP